MIKIGKRDWEILQEIISKYPYQFYAYGSRVKKVSRPFSDLDLCYKEEIARDIIVKLKGDLEDSNLSFIVDLVSWKKMNLEFQKMIEKDLIIITKKSV